LLYICMCNLVSAIWLMLFAAAACTSAGKAAQTA
jgi:hypothetical protein